MTCICRHRIDVNAVPTKQLDWAIEMIRLSTELCAHESDCTATRIHHNESCVAKASSLIKLANETIKRNMTDHGQTLRANVSPVLVAGLQYPCGTEVPTWEWIHEATAEIVGDKDGTTQVLDDVMQDIAESTTLCDAVDRLIEDAEEHGSENFRTHTVMQGEEKFSLTLQRTEGKTPDEIITELRAEIWEMKNRG